MLGGYALEERVMKTLDVVAATLLVVGGLNWGLVGLAGFDLVAWLSGAGGFGSRNEMATVIYIAVGLAALHQALGLRSIQRRWGVKTA
jgi:uncharacterized membrane protein YuzA (DUF378 family)